MNIRVHTDEQRASPGQVLLTTYIYNIGNKRLCKCHIPVAPQDKISKIAFNSVQHNLTYLKLVVNSDKQNRWYVPNVTEHLQLFALGGSCIYSVKNYKYLDLWLNKKIHIMPKLKVEIYQLSIYYFLFFTFLLLFCAVCNYSAWVWIMLL